MMWPEIFVKRIYFTKFPPSVLIKIRFSCELLYSFGLLLLLIFQYISDPNTFAV